ncbi:MAG: type II toxin-antitoxin system PemK/MazF family toxin [Euzebya sp.]
MAIWPCSTPAHTPLRAGDVVRVDFGVPRGSEAGFQCLAVIVTATEILEHQPRTLQVVPITNNTTRRMRTELPLQAGYPDRASVAQTHLITTIPADALTGHTCDPVTTTELAQIRQLLADQLDIA